MVEVDNLVSNSVSGDFTGAEIIDAVEVAYYYCSAIFGEDITVTSGTVGTNAITVADNGQVMAIVLLATAILIEGRKISDSKTDPSIDIRSTDDLFTPEMRAMLLRADETDPEEVGEGVMWEDDLPTSGWEVFSNTF